MNKKMNILSIIIFTILLSNNSSIVFGNNNINYYIGKEITSLNTNANVGIKIRNLKTNNIIFEQNSDKYYIFGSSLKTIVVFSLLKYFGPDYTFTSKLSKHHQDYYLDINDPDFSTADLEYFISQLENLKEKHITGNFYITDSQFTVPAQVDGRMIEDGHYCYGAKISKIHINKNCLRLSVQADQQLGSPVQFEINELIPYQIINKALTVSNKQHPKIRAIIDNEQLIVSGTLNESVGKLVIGGVVSNPEEHLKNMIRATLKKSNISVAGKILLGKSPTDSTLIAMLNKPITELGKTALKMSDNFITDYLIAEFGSRHGKKEWSDCGELLKQLVLEKFNIDLKKTAIVDGSGLSRHNMLTVNQFDEFLSTIYNDQAFEKLIKMLARPGEKGSLSKRFKNLKVYAKTGGMTGVSSIIGYVFDELNTPYSFVIVMNNYLGSKNIYRDFEEVIIKLLANG